MTTLLDMFKTENPDDRFIRCIDDTPEFQVFLVSDLQLDGVAKFGSVKYNYVKFNIEQHVFEQVRVVYHINV